MQLDPDEFATHLTELIHAQSLILMLPLQQMLQYIETVDAHGDDHPRYPLTKQTTVASTLLVLKAQLALAERLAKLDHGNPYPYDMEGSEDGSHHESAAEG
jgi:hypothetical protein